MQIRYKVHQNRCKKLADKTIRIRSKEEDNKSNKKKIKMMVKDWELNMLMDEGMREVRQTENKRKKMKDKRALQVKRKLKFVTGW